MAEQVSIGRIKRDVSILVDQVAYGGERILLTSRGKPKAALVSLEDLRQLERAESKSRRVRWQSWLADNEALCRDIREHNQGAEIPVDALLALDRCDLEERDG